jgi:hypothetical protein
VEGFFNNLNIERPTSNGEWEKMKKQTYDLEDRLLEYSVIIIKIVEHLPNTKAGNHVAGQLLRSGTLPFSFEVGRSMFDVRRSFFKTILCSINATCNF